MSLASEEIARGCGLAFSISPAKQKPKSKGQAENEDNDSVLTLAPFTKAPKINFGQVKVDAQVERNLLIINPQEFEVELKVSNRDLKIEDMIIKIEKLTNVDFKLKWQPDTPGDFKYTIFFEVTNCARLKFIVHAFGVCLKPVVVPKPRKPMVMLQPIKREKNQTLKAANTTIAPVKSSASNKENKEETKIQPKGAKRPATFTATVSTTATSQTFVAKPLPRLTNTVITTTSYNTSKQNPVTIIKPEFLSKDHLEAKKRQEWSNNFYKLDDEDDDTKFEENYGKLDDKTYVHNPIHNNATVLINRRETQIISSPSFQFKTSVNERYCSNEALYSTNAHAARNLKTPKMRRSVSNNNISSPSNWSFVDKTVVVVAGNEPHQSADDYDEYRYRSPSKFSTAKKQKRTRFASQELEIIDNDHTINQPRTDAFNYKSTGPVTPKYADFFQKEQLEKSLKKQINETNSNLSMFSSTVIANTKHIDITALGVSTFTNTPVAYKMYSQFNSASSKSNEKEITRIIPKESILDFYIGRQRLKELAEKVSLCQRLIRLKKFRTALKNLKIEEAKRFAEKIALESRLLTEKVEKQKREEKIYQEKLVENVIRLQRIVRMKRFRMHLEMYKQHLCAKIEYTIKCQRWIRMKNFRKALKYLLKERQRQEFEKKREECVITCQKAIRMKLFRKHLFKARVDRENLIRVTIKCQQFIRMKLFRKHLHIEIEKRNLYEANLLKSTLVIQRLFRKKLFNSLLAKRIQQKRLSNSCAIIIQRAYRIYKFRKQMNLYRCAAIKIQNWFKYEMRERIAYLKLRRGIIFLQKIYKIRFQEKKRAAILIQSNWRMYICKKRFKNKVNAALVLQKWWLILKVNRLRFLKLKRNMPIIEEKLHALIKQRNQAASMIQRVYRLYKFRKEMNKYRAAAIIIQKWTRSMSERYLFLRSKQAIYRIQMLYRNVYVPKRNAAAKVIQRNMRKFLARRRLAKEYELRFLNQQATRIQAYWRGYTIRKNFHLNHGFDQALNAIRGRLSIYGERSSGGEVLTLGARIRKAIKTLSQSCEIGKIINALQDLDKVTRLSPECCLTFIREDAHEYLYKFIETCNRSIPHMDLVKYCLKVFINLSKYDLILQKILKPQNSVAILVKLLQCNHSTNSSILQIQIFMNVCILFILLAQNGHNRTYLNAQESFVLKLLSIYKTLKNRSELHAKKKQDKQLTSTITATREQLLNTTASASSASLNSFDSNRSKICTTISFTIGPDWSLTKKEVIELNNSLHALEYFLNLLDISLYDESEMTPTCSSKLASIKENSTSKTSDFKKCKSLDEHSKTVQPKLTSASRALFDKKTGFQRMQISNINKTKTLSIDNFAQELGTPKLTNKNFDCQEEFEDDHASICSNESYRSNTSISTIKSVASFHSEAPKMNSTVMQAMGANRTFCKKPSEFSIPKFGTKK